MQKKVSSILNGINRPKSANLNILTIPTHERYEENLSRTGHNFFALSGDGPSGPLKSWCSDYAKIPDNYTILPPNRLPSDITFDLVLSQYRFLHWSLLAQIANQFQIPIVAIEHILLNPQSAPQMSAQALQLRAKKNVFISNFNTRVWGYLPSDPDVEIIHHGVNTDQFKNLNLDRTVPVLSVVNEIRERGWAVGADIFMAIAQTLEGQVKLVGKNEGMSLPITNLDDLTREYNSAKVFLNTSTFSPIPTVLLEAMACECPIVTTGTTIIPDVIQHGYNGLIYTSIEEAISHIRLLHNDPELARKLGQNARKTILEKFNMNQFVNKWNRVFAEVVE